MKKDSYFIHRHLVFNYPKKLRTFKEIIDEFKHNNNSVLEMIIELGLSTNILEQAYNHKKKEMSWKFLEKYNKQMKKSLSKENYLFFTNMMKHAKHLTSVITSEKEFRNQIKKYFYIEKRAIVGKIGNTYRMPIYSMKVKKNILSNFMRGRA